MAGNTHVVIYPASPIRCGDCGAQRRSALRDEAIAAIASRAQPTDLRDTGLSSGRLDHSSNCYLGRRAGASAAVVGGDRNNPGWRGRLPPVVALQENIRSQSATPLTQPATQLPSRAQSFQGKEVEAARSLMYKTSTPSR